MSGKQELGISIVELVLLIPVIMLLIFGGLELGMAYRNHYRLQYFAKEFASAAYRKCALLADTMSGGTMAQMNACLNESLSQSAGIFTEAFPGATVTLSAYRWNDVHTPQPPELFGQQKIGGTAAALTSVSDFELPAAVDGGGDDEDTEIRGGGGGQMPAPTPIPNAPNSDQLRRNSLLQREEALIYAEIVYVWPGLMPGFLGALTDQLRRVNVVQSI